MAHHDIRLKIHHIDGDMTAPWEYVDTFSKVGVGTPMAFSPDGVGSYDLASMFKAADEEGARVLKDIWISMGEYTDGVSFEEIMNAVNTGDESAVATIFSKKKAVPAVYLRNDMVLESVSPDTQFRPGEQVYMRINIDPDSTDRVNYFGWYNTIAGDAEDAEGYGLFTVIDAQPMVEGQALPQKLLLRYIG